MNYQGATSERRKKSRLVTEPAGVSKGGVPNAWHQRDTEHCLLDILHGKGILGRNATDNRDRYQAGMEIRRLWYTFLPSGVTVEAMLLNSPTFAYEADEMTGADHAREKFHRILRATSAKYRASVLAASVDDYIYQNDLELLIDGLDALSGAILYVRQNKRLT